jgi:cytoskeleton-associated protein 5
MTIVTFSSNRFQEDCLEALKHKTPSVNAETASFLTRAFCLCPAAVFTNKKMVKGYVSALLESLNHSGPHRTIFFTA